MVSNQKGAHHGKISSRIGHDPKENRYEKRKLEDPAVKEYKRSYKTHNARIRYGIMTREEFNEWSLEARKRRDLCIQGKLSLEDFVAWLDSDKR